MPTVESGGGRSTRSFERIDVRPPSGRQRSSPGGVPYPYQSSESPKASLHRFHQAPKEVSFEIKEEAVNSFKHSLISPQSLKELFQTLKTLFKPEPKSIEDLEKAYATSYTHDQPLKENFNELLEAIFKNPSVKQSIAMIKVLGFNPFKDSSDPQNKIPREIQQGTITQYYTIDDLFSLLRSTSSETFINLSKLENIFEMIEPEAKTTRKPSNFVTTAVDNPLRAHSGMLSAIASKLTLAYDCSLLTKPQMNRYLFLAARKILQEAHTRELQTWLNYIKTTEDVSEVLDILKKSLDNFSRSN